MKKILEQAAQINLVVFDVDGVMTNGEILLGSQGDEYKVFHVHDGLGMVMLRNAGFHVGVISARSSDIVAKRMADLEIEHVYQDQDNKREALNSLITKLNVPQEKTAFVGDDLVDLPAMRYAGLAIAVANAHPQVKQLADWVTSKTGGQGAVREICEMLLEARGELESTYKHYLSL